MCVVWAIVSAHTAHGADLAWGLVVLRIRKGVFRMGQGKELSSTGNWVTRVLSLVASRVKVLGRWPTAEDVFIVVSGARLSFRLGGKVLSFGFCTLGPHFSLVMRGYYFVPVCDNRREECRERKFFPSAEKASELICCHPLGW